MLINERDILGVLGRQERMLLTDPRLAEYVWSSAVQCNKDGQRAFQVPVVLGDSDQYALMLISFIEFNRSPNRDEFSMTSARVQIVDDRGRHYTFSGELCSGGGPGDYSKHHFYSGFYDSPWRPIEQLTLSG